jgi:hypothetical protein
MDDIVCISDTDDEVYDDVGGNEDDDDVICIDD